MSGGVEPAHESGSRTLKWALLAAAFLANGLLLWHFHDRYWYPTDDGLYAHVAQSGKPNSATPPKSIAVVVARLMGWKRDSVSQVTSVSLWWMA